MKRRFVALLFATLLAAGCGDLFEPAAAVVNGKKITIDDVEEGLEQLEQTRQFKQLAEQGDVDAYKREFEQTYLSQLVRRAVFEPKAEELGITVTDEDVQERIDQIIETEYPSESAFEEDLQEQGVPLDQVPILVRDLILTEELRAAVSGNVQPTTEEMRAFYQENIQDFTETRAQHILVETEERAREIAQQLDSAPRNQVDALFARLAKRFSVDESNADKGGDLGFFAPGDLVRPFQDAVDALDVGEISEPVETEFGWHIIRVTDRRKASFEDVRGGIARQLAGPAQDQAWEEWVIDAYEDADVEVNPRYGELDPQTQQIVNPDADSLPGVEVPETPAG